MSQRHRKSRKGGRSQRRRPQRQNDGPPVDLTISALGGRGDAIARLPSGEVVLVPGGAPGDEVRVQLHGKRSGVRRGTLIEITKPSPDRVTPPCPVADTCGGCNWQHVSLQRQRAEKATNAARTLGISVTQIGDPPGKGWRRRARFHLRQVDGQLRGGFMATGTDALVATPACHVLAPPLDTLPARVAAWASPWLEVGEGLAHLGKEGVILRVQGTAKKLPKPPNEETAALLGVVGLEIALEGRKLHWGLREVTLAETADAWPVTVNAGGFSQAGAEANTAIRTAVKTALSTLTNLDGARELFAGSGNLTGLLLDSAPRVTTMEFNAIATERAKRTLGDAGGRLTILTGDASDPGPPPVGKEVWLLDPGRPGAKKTCGQIAEHRPAAVIYVSCAPDTLRRDVAILKTGGYTMKRGWWVDTFPHTPHVEIIALLTLE
ncbi:MAG: class I SAM-dependent RNA methyltransferase [Myxococcales bacterium]|nr:class I SAM-dependent RNA methyltransferase [Myxococcales bacterium]